jgi:hypothetical protein
VNQSISTHGSVGQNGKRDDPMVKLLVAAIFCATATLFAAAALPDQFIGGQVAQYGATGILAVAVCWFMMKTIPDMTAAVKDLVARHAEELKTLVASHDEERTTFWARMDRWEEGAREDSVRLNGTLKEMTSHCRDTVNRMEADKEENP